MKSLFAALSIVTVAIGCTQPPVPQEGRVSSVDTTRAPSATGVPATLTGLDWFLVQLGDRMNPLGAGGRRVTLNLDPAENRATGFAGCNRYSGPYTVRGDSISFGPAISTRMACNQGMDVETEYLGALPRVIRYSVADTTLTLFGTQGQIAVLGSAR